MPQPQFSEQKGYYTEPDHDPEVLEVQVTEDIIDILRHRSRSLEAERVAIVDFYKETQTEVKIQVSIADLIEGVSETTGEIVDAGLEAISGLQHGSPVMVAEGSPFILVPREKPEVDKNEPTTAKPLTFRKLPPATELHGQINRVETRGITRTKPRYAPDYSLLATRRVKTQEACLVLDNAMIIGEDGEFIDISKAFVVVLPLHESSLDLREGVLHEPGVYEDEDRWAHYVELLDNKTI